MVATAERHRGNGQPESQSEGETAIALIFDVENLIGRWGMNEEQGWVGVGGEHCELESGGAREVARQKAKHPAQPSPVCPPSRPDTVIRMLHKTDFTYRKELPPIW